MSPTLGFGQEQSSGSGQQPSGCWGRRGDWFERLSCPHYTSELLVYFGLALLLQRPAGALPLLCSALNLGFTARQTHAWYRRKFEDYPAERWALIPYFF